MLEGVIAPPPALKHAVRLGVLSQKNETLPAGREAVLVLSFGTTYAANRAKTIDAVVQEIEKTYPKTDVVCAFTSHIVIRRIAENEGIHYPTPEQALDELKEKGYGRVTILSTDIIPGIEYDYIRHVFDAYKEDFHTLVLSTPLIYWQGQEEKNDDIAQIVEAVANIVPKRGEDEAVLLLAHGTPHIANAYYALIQLKLQMLGVENVFLYTVEGWPSIDDIIPLLEQRGIRKVTLMPFMLVAGDHANNDMSGDEEDSHKTVLEKAGFEVKAVLRGLGEYEAFRKVYVSRLAEALEVAHD